VPDAQTHNIEIAIIIKTNYMIKLILFTICLFISLLTTQGQWTQIGEDIDGEAEVDGFGCSVSLSSNGSIIAIGAVENDENGLGTGHVRIYKNIAGTWTQIGLDIDGEAEGHWFGSSISLSSDGSIVAIGAIDENGNDAGYVKVYQNLSDTWSQLGGNISGEAEKDHSGFSVSLSSDGSVVAIGAFLNDGNGEDAGHVRVYKNVSGTWTQIGSDIDGEAEGDWFGFSINLSADGSVVAIGAPSNNENGEYAGHVRIYKNIAGTWTQIGLDIDGEKSWNKCGASVSLNSDGSIVAIGANENDQNGMRSGHVRIYENISGTWAQVGTDIDGEKEGDQSGGSISLNSDGSIIAIGACLNDENGTRSGHVRIYKNISGTWIQIGADIDGEAEKDESGRSISLSSDGSVVAIGAYLNDGNGEDAGHVRIYKNLNTSGINDQSEKIEIYPNPVGDKLNIKINGSIVKSVRLFDAIGRIALERYGLIETIDLSDFQKGIYFLNIETDKEVLRSKILIDTH
jgi:hypothetical protein